MDNFKQCAQETKAVTNNNNKFISNEISSASSARSMFANNFFFAEWTTFLLNSIYRSMRQLWWMSIRIPNRVLFRRCRRHRPFFLAFQKYFLCKCWILLHSLHRHMSLFLHPWMSRISWFMEIFHILYSITEHRSNAYWFSFHTYNIGIKFFSAFSSSPKNFWRIQLFRMKKMKFYCNEYENTIRIKCTPFHS